MKNMEDRFKNIIVIAVRQKIGHAVEITEDDWQEAKREVLNDIYANKIIMFQDIKAEYIINTMVSILELMKRQKKSA